MSFLSVYFELTSDNHSAIYFIASKLINTMARATFYPLKTSFQ